MRLWNDRGVGWTMAACSLLAGGPALANTTEKGVASRNRLDLTELNDRLRVGDVVFIQVKPLPFREVSKATQSWVNHVGIVTDMVGKEATIAESTFPFSRVGPLSRFVARSDAKRVAVARLDVPLATSQTDEVGVASAARLGVLYDTGFNLNSRGQYCSRFVREVLVEATGVTLGEVESFGALLARNPDASLGFWRFWFFGRIPWDRQTVTPASLYRSDRLRLIFDGHVV